MMDERIPERSELSHADCWNLGDLFPSDDAFRAALQEARGYLAELASYRGRLGESGETLAAYLQANDRLSADLDRLANYAQRRSDEDTRVAACQEMTSQVMRLGVELQAASAFETPEILAIDDETLARFYDETPALGHYRLALDRVRRRRAHILSEQEEAILAQAGEMAAAPDEIFSMFNDADLTFPDATDSAGKAHPVTHGTFVPLMQSTDRALRKSAFDALYGEYGRFRNTAAAVLSAQMKQLLFFAKARRYDSTLDAALDGTEVPTEIYHRLISAVHDGLAPLHRYVDLRRRRLGLDSLHMYDLYAPIAPDADLRYTFDEAKELAKKALAPLGPEYLALLQKGFTEGWIDVYENRGKRSGAYSAGARVHPYVLLNFKGRLDDVFTLVHEMGHAIHSYLSNTRQSETYSQYVIFVAEVASTCNEALLMQYLLETTTDPKIRAYLLGHFLEQFRATLYRQTMFAEFELMVNRMTQAGEGVTAEALCEKYRALNQQYFGENIIVDEEIALEWARIPHFYYDYYVYQYATGYAAALALSSRIRREGETAVADYLRFLSGGCSADPITLLRGAGVDMASPAPVEDAIRQFSQVLDEMEKLTADA